MNASCGFRKRVVPCDFWTKEELQSFQQKSGSFRLLSATDLRGVIRQELGNDLEVRGTGHYLVFGQKQSVEEFAPWLKSTAPS